MVPGVPLRQSLPCIVACTSTSDAPTGDGGGHDEIGDAAVVAALAAGLCQGGSLEWQHGCSKMMPALAACGLLPDPPGGQVGSEVGDGMLAADGEKQGAPPSAPMPVSPGEATVVRWAHCILLAMNSQVLSCSDHEGVSDGGDGGCDDDGRGVGSCAGGASDRSAIHSFRLSFATGFAKWLCETIHDTQDPLTAAHLLGITLRASTLCPPAAAERYFIARMSAQQRLVELASTRSEEGAEGSDGALCRALDTSLASRSCTDSTGRGWHTQCVDTVARSLMHSSTASQRKATTDASGTGSASTASETLFVPIDEL
jgi:hypothetical protein